MTEKSDGVFASALKRLTGAGSSSGAASAPPPGAAVKQVRGAAYPPLFAPVGTPASTAGAKPGVVSRLPSTTAAAAVSSSTYAGAPPPPSSTSDASPIDPRAAPAAPAAASSAASSSSSSAATTAAAAAAGTAAAPGGDGGAAADAAGSSGAAPSTAAVGGAGTAAAALPRTASGGASASASGGLYEPGAGDPVLAASIRCSLRSAGKSWPDEGTPAVRLTKFQRCLDAPVADIDVTLRQLAWAGVPAPFRVASWQLLLGHLPANRDRHSASLSRKKLEYQQCVAQYFGGRGARSEAEQTLLRQVLVDVPRTFPDIPLLRCDFVQRSLERVLYVWALRHPASGYVQGLNDLCSVFYAVFLSPWADLDSRDLTHVDPLTLLTVEADIYWCFKRLLDTIQDHYTPSQPGIQRMTFRLRELVHRIDEALVLHLENNGVEFRHFAFRWMNCLLMREIPFRLIVRIWDTCLAEKDGFDTFHVYVCAAFLLKFAPQLKSMKFTELVTFIQRMPTSTWSVKDVEELLAQAYVYKTLFEASPSHLSS